MFRPTGTGTKTRTRRGRLSGVTLHKGCIHLWSHLKGLRTDGRAEPGEQLRRGGSHRGNRRLKHARLQSTPPRVSGRHDVTRLGAK